MRVLHLPTQVGGNAWNLSRGERNCGIDSDVIYRAMDVYFAQKGDIDFPIINKKHPFRYAFAVLKLYWSIINVYDVIHFNFGTTMLDSKLLWLINLPDLYFLKRHKKIIAVTFQGSDARQADYCLENYKTTYFSELNPKALRKKLKLCAYQRRKIAKFDKYADIIYATNPDLLNMLPPKAKFRPYTKLDVNGFIPCYSDYKKERLVIAHAPTNREIKGTKYVLDVLQQLVEEGYPVEIKLVEGLTNKDALELYKNVDLVVDQLFVGWYGGLAVECMALGKPVVAYIRETDMKHIPQEMREDLPIISANKDTLREVLIDCISNRDMLAEKAYASRKFVERWHNNEVNAKEVIADYKRIIDKRR